MITELSIFLPNKPGILGELLKMLSVNSIEIRAISVVETADYGLILMLVDKPNECIDLLEENNYEFTSTEVIAIELGENPTKLFNVANELGSKEINIEYLYSTTLKGKTIYIIRVDDSDKAINVFNSMNLKRIRQVDL